MVLYRNEIFLLYLFREAIFEFTTTIFLFSTPESTRKTLLAESKCKVEPTPAIVACYRTSRRLHSKCDSVTCQAILVELF